MTLIRRLRRQLESVRARVPSRLATSGWVMTCPCGTTVSIWDLRGARYRVSSRRVQRAAVCPSCRQRFVSKVQRVTA